VSDVDSLGLELSHSWGFGGNKGLYERVLGIAYKRALVRTERK